MTLYSGNGGDGAGVLWDEPFFDLYVGNADDCDDGEPLAWTGATEVCDGVDNDCDGDTDGTAVDSSTWYADTDSDTYGDPNTMTDSCDQPSGYVSNADDCDDGEPLAWTGATEVCDGVDNNCIDDELDAVDQLTWYADSDSDGFGDPTVSIESCDQPSGYVNNADDCNDSSNAPCLDYVIDGVDDILTSGTYQFDSVSIVNGGTLFIEGEVILEIGGELLVDATSAINGDGGGYAGNTTEGSGNGPCAGVWQSSEAASGGGYGGLGGDGGTDNIAAVGGCTYGTQDGMTIYMGSSGGTTDQGAPEGTGGSGGAAISITSSSIDISGTVTMNGESGFGDGTQSIGRNGGGGAGGGILLAATNVNISGTLTTIGGDGGSGNSPSNDGGGAGGGGRIKIFYASSLNFGGVYDVAGGTGGEYGDAQYGQDGAWAHITSNK